MFFSPRANQTFKSGSKCSKNHFHENHFWAPSKSFSCLVNHFWTGSKWFFTAVNHFFSPKNSKKWFFVAVNHFKKIISKWKWFFSHEEIIISKTWVKSFLCQSFPKFRKKKQIFLLEMIYCSRKSFLRTSKTISLLLVVGNHFFAQHSWKVKDLM